jgi:hypothetical protein
MNVSEQLNPPSAGVLRDAVRINGNDEDLALMGLLA